MSRYFKIHPGIGIARVGKSTDGYFVKGEKLTDPPFELSSSGITAFKGYKDASFLMRRQAVRFRVFEYDKNDGSGALTFRGEVTPDNAIVGWNVELGAAKPAGPFMADASGSQGEKVIVPTSGLRNNGIDRAKLAANASVTGLTGSNTAVRGLIGTIMGKTVLLGGAATDDGGRLVMLGGSGQTTSWSDNPPDIKDYLNNDGWFDDIADGPIDAELTFPDGTRHTVDEGAWLIVAPPDFAPDVDPIVSLYDLMYDVLVQKGRLAPPSVASFEQHIWPYFERAARLRWVNDKQTWQRITTLLPNKDMLADKSSTRQQNRKDAYSLLLRTESSLQGFVFTKTQRALFEKWVNGDFETNPAVPPLTKAEDLDRAVLCRCIGSGLFPGIEMGYMATNPGIYSGLGRFTRGTFQDFNGPNQLKAGSITQRMALPWQADFMECDSDWWPVQRPDYALANADGSPANPALKWNRGLVVNNNVELPSSHLNMVRHFAQLGVVQEITVAGKTVLAETGRDPSLSS